MYSSFICVFLLALTTVVVQSAYVYVPEVRRLIGQHKLVATWEDAKRRCESEGAILASPIDTQLLEYMKKVIAVNNHTTPYFIGTKANNDAKVTFVSEEGVLLEDIPEILDMIEQLDVRDGECLCMDGHNIRSVPCRSRLPYICYTNVAQVTTTELPSTTELSSTTESPTTTVLPCTTAVPTTTPRDCNKGYTLDTRTMKYYKLYNGEAAAAWDDAKSICAAEGGYIALPKDSEEALIFTYNAFPSGTGEKQFAWIGFKYTAADKNYYTKLGHYVKNIYLTIENDHVYNWGTGDCVGLWSNEALESRYCYERHPFICEKKTLATC